MSKGKQKSSSNAQSKKRKGTLTSPPHPKWFRVVKTCFIVLLWLVVSITIALLIWELYKHRNEHRNKGEHHHTGKHSHEQTVVITKGFMIIAIKK
jgi:heme/copper-type cytochrome/quinol oxidase subunit 2